MTLQQLLQMKVESKDKDGNPIEITPDFRVAVQHDRGDAVYFIIHADGHDSDTLDLIVSGNEIRQI